MEFCAILPSKSLNKNALRSIFFFAIIITYFFGFWYAN